MTSGGVVLTLVGVVLIGAAWHAALRTVLVPSETGPWLARWAFHAARVTGGVVVPRLPYRWRRGALDLCASVALLAMLVGWTALNAAGFVLLASAWMSGGSRLMSPVLLFDPGRAGGFTELAWLSTVVLVVLFGVHATRFIEAWARRDRMVATIGDRLGGGEDAETLLADFVRTNSRDRLDATFAEWASWAGELRRSHALYPLLLLAWPGRQPCWAKAMTVVTDAASLTMALAPTWSPPHTGVLVDGGARCLQDAAAAVGVFRNRAQVSLEWREERRFSDTVTMMRRAGLPVECSEPDAWESFQHMRLRYSPYASEVGERLLYGTAGPPPDELVGAGLTAESR